MALIDHLARFTRFQLSVFNYHQMDAHGLQFFVRETKDLLGRVSIVNQGQESKATLHLWKKCNDACGTTKVQKAARGLPRLLRALPFRVCRLMSARVAA